MTNTKEDRIKEFLGTGLTQVQAARAIGVDESYVSQLMAVAEFREAVEDMRGTSLLAKTRRDLTYDSIEDKLAETLDEMIDQGRFSKPEEVLVALKTVNQLTRRGTNIEPGRDINQGEIVKLQLPQVIKNKIVLNTKGVVIQVGDQSMLTMGSKQLVREIIDNRKPGIENETDFGKLEKQIQYLPGSEKTGTEG